MTSFAVAFFVSLLSSLFIMRIARLQGEWGIDRLSENPRKLHRRPVPRIGGAGIMVAALVASAVVNLRNAQAGPMVQMMILTALPSFAGGITDDLSGQVSIRFRLFLMTISASIAALLFGFTVIRTDINWIDGLLQSQVFIAYLLTLAALIGITNGMNLIDGLNGLAGMSSIVMFLGLASAAFAIGDSVVFTIAMTMTGAIAGFFIWNWPRGYLFMGDGGAYFVGHMLGLTSIVFVSRNPQVSAWFPVLLLIYPLVEVLFSIWRRKVLRGRSIAIPDAAHLHHLIYRRVVRATLGANPAESQQVRHAFAAPYLWALTSMAVFPAVAFMQNTRVLMLFTLVFVVSYIWLYIRIVRLRVPRWLSLFESPGLR
ncbi:MAG: undecaprenyl/decaprenyl-phosphate alpha-N-acetylglucosaminyl 1-phosphate transferase [Betaproteobacteria bacterium]|nr:undecaprenyl/decaprenyl-phosphate alpha-N-acetylglucosaminyl 1-phosphate transferase [Betaproteobacteria bacterium]NDD11160.1 undecaprenyl/decaprenyl-phosphate alpha-N-acetylglucosaminyl 1-phosphate transferase [Betaproteobacteria bacterium]